MPCGSSLNKNRRVPLILAMLLRGEEGGVLQRKKTPREDEQITTTMIVRSPDTPTFFLVSEHEGKPIIIADNLIASLEIVAELEEVCKIHRQIFPTNDLVEKQNDSIREMQADYLRKMASTPKEKPKPPRNEVAFVYLGINKLTKRVKIGFSSKPEMRERTLQEEVPDFQIIHKVKGTWQDEQNLHAKFASKRIRGEWFDLSEEEIEMAKTIMDSNILLASSSSPP